MRRDYDEYMGRVSELLDVIALPPGSNGRGREHEARNMLLGPWQCMTDAERAEAMIASDAMAASRKVTE